VSFRVDDIFVGFFAFCFLLFLVTKKKRRGHVDTPYPGEEVDVIVRLSIKLATLPAFVRKQDHDIFFLHSQQRPSNAEV